jgi:hypothetical protein
LVAKGLSLTIIFGWFLGNLEILKFLHFIFDFTDFHQVHVNIRHKFNLNYNINIIFRLKESWIILLFESITSELKTSFQNKYFKIKKYFFSGLAKVSIYILI